MASCGDYDLPEDLLVDIMLRLPVKSLLCSKCVCKYWYTLIESPTFIRTHLNDPKKHPRLLVHYFKLEVLKVLYRSYPDFALFPDDGTLANDDSKSPPVQEDIDYPLKSRFSKVHGPVDGLFLVHHDPPWKNYIFKGLNLGFGLDPFTNAYKVVWIFFFVDMMAPPYDSDNYPPLLVVVAVYNLATDSWRQFDDSVLPSSVNGLLSPYALEFTKARTCAYLNGAYYWISRDYDNGRVTSIVVFDMAREVFRDIQLPCNPENSGSCVYPELMLRNDSIALLLCRYSASISRYIDIFKGLNLESTEVWTMEPMRHGCRWTKHFISVPRSIDVRCPLGFSKNGDIFLETRDQNLLLYNTNTHEVRDFGTHGTDLKLFSYQESVARIMPRSRRVTPATACTLVCAAAAAPAPEPEPLSLLKFLALKIAEFVILFLYDIRLVPLE
ncbi:hypothetical protein LguiB_008944 [Lonicera macranthoides]